MKLIETQQTKPRENITIEFTPDEADALHAVVGCLVSGCPTDSPRKHISRLYDLLDDYCSHDDNKIPDSPFVHEHISKFKTYKELQND